MFSVDKMSAFESASAMWDVSDNIIGGGMYSLRTLKTVAKPVSMLGSCGITGGHPTPS